MRIIAGQYRTRKLVTLAQQSSRPSSDRLKEALFSTLGGFCYHQKWLDLFAGCGAIGLEAISRGADHVVFCDNDRIAIQSIHKNIESLKVASQTMVLESDYQQALLYCQTQQLQFERIFADPPYNMDINEISYQVLTNDLLSPKGLYIAESSKDTFFANEIKDYVKIKESRYGISKFAIYRNKEAL